MTVDQALKVLIISSDPEIRASIAQTLATHTRPSPSAQSPTTPRHLLKTNAPGNPLLDRCIVYTAETWQEGLESAGRLQPRLVFIEDLLTGRDPARAAGDIRDASPGTLPMVVMLTRDTSRAIEPEKGFDGIVTLPAKPSSLAAWLDTSRRIAAAEAVTREVEQRYQTLFETAADAFFLLKDAKVVDLNRAAETLFGRSREELMGTSPEYVSPEYQANGRKTTELIPELVARVEREGQVRFDWTYRHTSGALFEAEVHLSLVELHGEPHLQAIVRDMTQKRAAELIEKARAEESQRLAEAAFQVGRCTDPDDLCRLLADFAYAYNPNSYIIVSMFGTGKKTVRVRKALGFGNFAERIRAITGFDFTRMDFPINELTPAAREYYSAGRLLPSNDGFYGIAEGLVPRPVCRMIELMMEVDTVYQQGFEQQGELVGSLVIITRKGHPLKGQSTIEILSNNVAQVIKRIQAEKAQLESLTKYQVLFNSVALGVMLTDSNGKIIEANRASEKLLDVPLEEQLKRSLDDPNWKIHYLDGSPARPQDMLEHPSILVGEQIDNVEVGYHRADGSQRWLNLTIAPMPLEGHSVAMMFADETARVEAANEVRRLNRLYAVLSHTNRAIVRVRSQQELFDEVCRVAIKYGQFRYAWIGLIDPVTNEVKRASISGEGLGAFANKLVYADERPGGFGPSGVAIRTQKYFVYNDARNHADLKVWTEAIEKHRIGSVASFPIWCDGKIRGVFGLGSETINFFNEQEVALLEEIAGSVSFALDFFQEEENRRRAEAALRDSLNRLRQFFDQPLIGMNIKNQQNEYLEINDRYCEMIGYSREEFKNLRWQDITHPDDAVVEEELYQRLQRGEIDGYEIEKRMIRKDGQTVWWSVAVRGVGKPDGEVDYIIALATDITGRKLAEQKNRLLLEQQVAINQLSLALGEIKDLREIYCVIYSHVKIRMNTDAFVLSLYDKTDQQLTAEFMVVDGIPVDVSEFPKIPLHEPGKGTQSRVIHTGQPVYVPDFPHGVKQTVSHYYVDNDGHYEDLPPEAFEGDIVRSMLLVPMKMGGEIIGIMQSQSYRSRAYTPEDMELLSGLANVAAIAVQNARLDAALRLELAERIKTEEALRNSEERHRNLFNSVPIGLYRSLADGSITDANPALLRILGMGEEKAPARLNAIDFYHDPEDRAQWLKQINQQEIVNGVVSQWQRRDGKLIWVQENSSVIRDESGLIYGYEGSIDDITERKLSEERVQRHFRKLDSLHQIDMAISSTIDLQVMLKVLLNQVVWQLSADAAAVLISQPDTQSLKLVAEIGLAAGKSPNPFLRIGEGLAGTAALQRRTAYWERRENGADGEMALPLFKAESVYQFEAGFAVCFAAPLIAKGKVLGVLEVFHRNPFVPEAEWLDFLDMLSGQAAIAIDNASLFQELQITNTELRVAYDTTLEGWSHALDMRDKETEGHSRRVTDLTVLLGHTMGIRDEELVHIRRGALLHDIGKMGIPDKILLKPGALDEEEWEIMRRHPQYAYDLLYPIPYLRQALTIPYCHHERWDGNGYPRRLKGTEIPLEARIFAVVDAWDALCNDRPYRKAWPRQQALDYITEQSGKAFDPEVVKVFLKLIDERDGVAGD